MSEIQGNPLFEDGDYLEYFVKYHPMLVNSIFDKIKNCTHKFVVGESPNWMQQMFAGDEEYVKQSDDIIWEEREGILFINGFDGFNIKYLPQDYVIFEW